MNTRDPRLRRAARELLGWWPAGPGVLALVLAWASFGGNLVDDAYISLTYARQLVAGHGLVFHPALPPAEGYSNLLWTLLLAMSMALGIPGPSAATGLGLIFGGLTVALVARRIGGAAGALVGVAIAASPIFGYWAGRGLEGSLLSLLLLAGVLRLGTNLGWAGFGLIAITRPEGLLYGLLPLVYTAVARPGGRPLPSRRALALWWGPALIQIGYRLWAYGAWLPSTAAAKTAGSEVAALGRGLSWLAPAAFLEIVLVGALGLALARRWRDVELRRALWPAALAVGGLLGYSVAAGGDWMPNYRWLQPAIPLAWWIVGVAMAERPRVRLALAGLAIAVGAAQGERVDGGATTPRSWAQLGQVLREGQRAIQLHPAHLFTIEWLPEDEVVLMPDVGMLAWVSGNPVLDPQGLTWREVADSLAVEPSSPVGEARMEAIRQTVQGLRPALVALVLQGSDGKARGPVANALIGSGRASPAWFSAGWTRWRELRYGGAERLVFYLRNDVRAPTTEAALDRLAQASARVPYAPGLVFERIRLLQQLGRRAEAEALRREVLGQQEIVTERWSL